MTLPRVSGGPSRPSRLEENGLVRLTVDLLDEGRLFAAGATGTVIHVYRDGAVFEVEFTRPIHGVVTVKPEDLEAVTL